MSRADPFKSCLVLMAVHNPNNNLLAQLSSIALQENVHVSLKISLDSPESSMFLREALEVVQAKHPSRIANIDIINGPRRGSAASNFFNLAINEASDYDYYAFCDQDDIWLPHKLSSAITSMMHSQSDCYSSELLVWECGQPFSSASLTRRSLFKRKHFKYFFAESAGCTYVMNGKAFSTLRNRLIRLLDARILFSIFSHDLFTSVFLQIQGFKWFHDHNSYIYYRQHAQNQWGASVLTFSGLRKRLSILFSGRYLLLLIAAWKGCDKTSPVYLSLYHLLSLKSRDKIYLLRFALSSTILTDLRLYGLLLMLVIANSEDYANLRMLAL